MTLDELKAAADRCITELDRAGGYPDGLEEDDVRALATLVRGLSPHPTAVRVEYRCSRDDGYTDLTCTYDSRNGGNEECAQEFVGRINARECCTLTRVVHTLAVEVEAPAPETAGRAGTQGER